MRAAFCISTLRPPEPNWRGIPQFAGQEGRIGEILTLFRKHLDVLDQSNELTERGFALIDALGPDTGSSDEGLEKAEFELTPKLQELLWKWIWNAHQLPMLAALHQISLEHTSSSQNPHRAYSHYVRISHLEKYSDVAVTSHKFRAKVHFSWLKQLQFATVQNGALSLTPKGEFIYERFEDQYPNRWVTAYKRAGRLVNEHENHAKQSRIDLY